jgi:ribosomal protein L40E
MLKEMKRNPGAMAGDGFKERFEEFKKTKWAIPISLVITVIVSIVLLLTTWYLCFSYALIAVVAFAIPYYFGFKSLKKLALFGVVLFIILGATFGVYTADLYRTFEGDAVDSPNGELTNGTMASLGGDQFQYMVFLNGGNGSQSVFVIVENNWGSEIGFNESMDPLGPATSDGQMYIKNMTLPYEDVYFYVYSTEGADGWIFSYRGTGPIRVPYETFVMSWIISDILVVFINIAILFFILLGLVYWTKSSRQRYERMQKEKDELALPKEYEESPIEEPGTQEKFVCSECGVEVPADASECIQCGEPFEEEGDRVKTKGEMKCPKCGAEIFETDEKCWNCGTNIK